jgi:hypothetical protein
MWIDGDLHSVTLQCLDTRGDGMSVRLAGWTIIRRVVHLQGIVRRAA